MEPAGRHADRHILVPAAVSGPFVGGRDREAAVRRAGPLAAAELGAGPDADAVVREFHAAGETPRPRSLRHEILPRFRPLSGRPAAPAMGGRGRCRRTVRPFAGRHGADASELLPVARQTLFPCRRAPARGVRHPRYGAQPAFDGGVAPRTARGEDRLDDARLHAAALLSGQQQRFDASQFRQRPRRTARQTADRIRRGAVQCLGHRESPRRMAALVALQALARARCGHRIRFHRRERRYAAPPDSRRRGGDVAHAGGGEHPQRLGQPRADVAAGLLADEGPAHRYHPQPDGPRHHHRHAGIHAGRIPRGRPVHADPSERREHRFV